MLQHSRLNCIQRLVITVQKSSALTVCTLQSTALFYNPHSRKLIWEAMQAVLQHTMLVVLRVQGFVGRALGDPGLKPTVRVGEAALREVAAFLLDHDGFAKVRHLPCPPSLLHRAVCCREMSPTSLNHPPCSAYICHVGWLNKCFLTLAACNDAHAGFQNSPASCERRSRRRCW